MLINTNHFNVSSTIGCMNLLNANRIITAKRSNESDAIYRIKEISQAYWHIWKKTDYIS